MSDPLRQLFEASRQANLFPATSRYHGAETAVLETEKGKPTVYLLRRFAPPPENFSLLKVYTVTQTDRLDTITAKQLGDPGQFWRLCDANAAMDPLELTETVGRKLRITLPEGIPGVSDA